ncbi:MAG: hypothetical protein IJU91_04985, partial [Selenomonadaceae bacterium]|nr:hypothetical protein [Selenomonadaceae bacterium]
DGGRRKFIMVQIPEPCAEDTEAYKAGYKNICEIGKERIRRAGSKIKAEMPLTTADIGFRVLKLDTSNFKDAYLAPEETTQDILKRLEDIIKEDRTAEDLLFSSLIACGLELTKTYEVEEYESAKLINYGGGEMLACFDREISMSVIRHMAEKKPRRAVIRDDAFQRDADKINTDGIFKQISPSTRVKII